MYISLSERLYNLESLVCNTAALVPHSIGCTVSGTAMSALSLAILGSSKGIDQLADDQLGGLGALLPQLYAGIIRVVNPRAEFSFEGQAHSGTIGFLTEKIATPIFQKACELREYENPSSTQRRIYSRLAFATLPVVATITRLADFALGLLATAFSLISLGAITKVNDAAYRQLSILGLVLDFSAGIRGVVNPMSPFRPPEFPEESLYEPPGFGGIHCPPPSPQNCEASDLIKALNLG